MSQATPRKTWYSKYMEEPERGDEKKRKQTIAEKETIPRDPKWECKTDDGLPWIRLVQPSSPSKIDDLSSDMKELYDNGKKKLMKALFDPELGAQSPFIIAKCMDNTTQIHRDRTHWEKAPSYPTFVPCNPVTHERAVFHCPDLSTVENQLMVSMFGETLRKMHYDVTNVILCNNIENPEDAYVLEELLQNYAGLSWCLLNMRIGQNRANFRERQDATTRLNHAESMR